jgi:hypothetical protein
MVNSCAADMGPIRVSENGRYFVDQNGHPFFWLGDTQWQLLRSFTLAEAEEILENRRQKGFTVVQAMVTGLGDGTAANLEGHTPWLDHNPATPNAAYFENVDAILQLGRQKRLVMVLYLCHNRQRDYVHPGNARAYARWVAQRYKDVPNLIWAFVTQVPLADHLPLIRELAAGVQEGDGGTHLISYHPDPVRPALSSGEIHTESWLAFNMIQTWAYYEGIYGMVTRDYHRTPARPVVMAEGAYEDETDSEYGFVVTPLLVRKQAYWSHLTGGYHSYGHSDCWRVPATWKSALDAPGAFQMGVLKRLFVARQWWDLVPDQSLFADQVNPGTTLHTAARSQSGDWAIVYLSSPTRVSIRMAKIAAANKVDAFWIDPQTGTRASAGTFQNTGTQAFSTPGGWKDAILLLEAAKGA